MKNYNTKIKPEKKNPPVTIGIMVAAWSIFFTVAAYDIYRFCFASAAHKPSVGVYDILCDIGVAVVAVWFTVCFIKQRKQSKSEK